MRGVINSFQSLGTVDGPGVRFVVFMQGCPLRCIYCHNPETWNVEGREYELEDVFARIMKYKPYFAENGGVTISGGEPLLQWEFVAALLTRLQEAGIHTAVDTSGIGTLEGSRQVLKVADLVICDLKFATEKEYFINTRAELKKVIEFLQLTQEMEIPLWIRHVIIPGITGSENSISEIAEISSRFSNLEKFEFLPFKKLCLTKYEASGVPFPLENCAECSDEVLQAVKKQYSQISHLAKKV